VDPPFSLTRGGPTYRLWQVLARGDWVRLSMLVIAVTWVPIVVLSIVEWRATGQLPALFVSFSLHVKALIAVPLLLAAENVLHVRTCRCIDRIVDERWAEPPAAVAALTTAAERRRDSRVAEAVVLAVALFGSQAVTWGLGKSIGVIRGRGLDQLSAAAVWNSVVTLSVYQFLLYRWLWRWWIWSRLLWGLARLKLRVLPTHADKQGGLGFLALVSSAFGIVIFAISAVQSSVWADQVAFANKSALSFKSPAAVLLVLCLLIAFGPLIPFVRQMWVARLEAVRQYGKLAADYARLFHARWIQRGEREDLLGSPDIQSLADIGASYDVIREMRPVPFSLQSIIAVVLAVLAPMLPLVLMEVPLVELLSKLSGVGLGGVAH
jgi:hypothetical protein